MTEKKMTKSVMFTEIRDILADAGYEEYADAMQKEVDSLAAKALKAKEKAAAKAVEVDDLKAAVAGALTDELQTGAAIFDLVGDDENTLGKVRARLTALVHEGVAVKEEVKDDKRTVMAYRLA